MYVAKKNEITALLSSLPVSKKVCISAKENSEMALAAHHPYRIYWTLIMTINLRT